MSQPKPPSRSQKKDANAWLQYAAAVAKTDDTKTTLQALNQAKPLVPRSHTAEFYLQAGRILRLAWLIPQAIQSFDKAAKSKQYHQPAIHAKAECLERIHQLDRALQLLEQTPAKNSQTKLLHSRILRRLGELDAAEHQLNQAAKLANKQPLSYLARIQHEHYLLEDTRGNYPTAWKHLEQSKSLLREDWQGSKLDRWLASRRKSQTIVLELLKSLDADDIHRWREQVDSLTPRTTAFILGLPRSGTSLVEKLLRQHPHVATTDERDILATEVFEPFTATVQLTGDLEHNTSTFTTALSQLSSSSINQSIKRYYQQLDRQLRGKHLIIDKNPGYSESALLIARMVPHAKIIYPERDHRAVLSSAYSVFPEHPTEINIFWQDLDSLAEWINFTHRTWQTLKPLLPTETWHETHYADLVTDPDQEIRGMHQFLQLDSSEKPSPQAQPHQPKRILRSPSYVEIQQAPNTHSLEKWQNYQDQLQAGLALLDQ